LCTYGTLGALAGTFGAALPIPTWALNLLSVVVLVGFAGTLAGALPAPEVRVPWVSRWVERFIETGPVGSLPLGIATGMLPCGLVYSALALPISAAHPGWGAAAMIAFGLGTVPLLSTAAGGVQALMRRGIWARRLLATAVLITGLMSVAMRATMVASEPQCHEPSQ